MKDKNIKLTYKEIAAEIIEMAKADQEAIIDPVFWNGKNGKNLVKKHANRMKEIIAEIRWPTISKVGKKASESAWLLVQHSNHDLAFQKQCLEKMKTALTDVDRKRIAYLEDRIRINDGLQKQVYGTQWFVEDDQMKLRPIEDPENVEMRRQMIGLPTIAESKRKLDKWSKMATKKLQDRKKK